jgi:hypothetical protein
MPEPTVTVVISPREGHFMSVRSLLSVLADASAPFELIYIDIASPPQTAASLRREAQAHGFRLVRHDDWIAPALARKKVLADIETTYVAFIDNDILVEPGCLRTLIDCAEETGAGLVCPLYLQIGGGLAATIHMAGGVFTWADGELVAEHHHLAGQPAAVAQTLTRANADYTEYHYLLARTDFIKQPRAVSDEILLIHEHLDLALVARQQGVGVVVEPAAQATYVAFEPRPLRDLPFYRWRWSREGCRASVDAFGRKWLGSNTRYFVEETYDYIDSRLQEVELRRKGSTGTDLHAPMTRFELAQTRHALREQAAERGYSDAERLMFEEVADLATLAFDGVYRPDGRPFLNHAIGTASALIRYELNADIVRAGLLHSLLTHRPAWMAIEAIDKALATMPRAELLVRGQKPARRVLASDDTDVLSLNVVGAAIVTLLAANEVDMRLSGEYAATGRLAEIDPRGLDRIGEALSLFGIDGLARTARPPTDQPDGRPWPLLGVGVRTESFRLDAQGRRLLPISDASRSDA